MLCLPMSSKILALEPALHCAPNERHVKAKKKKKEEEYLCCNKSLVFITEG